MAIPIVEIIKINNLGSNSSLPVLHTEAVLKPIKRTYPPPKASATGILNKSCGCRRIFSKPTANNAPGKMF